MIKRTLIAFAVIAFVASVVPAANTKDTDSYPPFEVYSFDVGQSDDQAVKVDGKKTVRWPFDYKFLEICRIPLKMKLGMYIRVKDCDKSSTEIVLKQKDCEDVLIGKQAKHWPCYYGCETIKILANFNAEIDAKVVSQSDVIDEDDTKAWADPDNIVGDGEYHSVDICVKTWETKIEKGAAGDETKVGYVSVLARPEV
ncbi:MAG: hypothetical protein ACYTAO_11840 [Planctomycetota bacterium]|jgi:hypothetical protein